MDLHELVILETPAPPRVSHLVQQARQLGHEPLEGLHLLVPADPVEEKAVRLEALLPLVLENGAKDGGGGSHADASADHHGGGVVVVVLGGGCVGAIQLEKRLAVNADVLSDHNGSALVVASQHQRVLAPRVHLLKVLLQLVRPAALEDLDVHRDVLVSLQVARRRRQRERVPLVGRDVRAVEVHVHALLEAELLVRLDLDLHHRRDPLDGADVDGLVPAAHAEDALGEVQQPRQHEPDPPRGPVRVEAQPEHDEPVVVEPEDLIVGAADSVVGGGVDEEHGERDEGAGHPRLHAELVKALPWLDREVGQVCHDVPHREHGHRLGHQLVEHHVLVQRDHVRPRAVGGDGAVVEELDHRTDHWKCDERAVEVEQLPARLGPGGPVGERLGAPRGVGLLVLHVLVPPRERLHPQHERHRQVRAQHQQLAQLALLALDLPQHAQARAPPGGGLHALVLQHRPLLLGGRLAAEVVEELPLARRDRVAHSSAQQEPA
mmetsp:Transcript_23232/g.74806  ORF Transcript_23232/g.74806 Transcript_23232/m.74806 type:complete len:492 (-) Transcript_23232:346-1821(-)